MDAGVDFLEVWSSVKCVDCVFDFYSSQVRLTQALNIGPQG